MAIIKGFQIILNIISFILALAFTANLTEMTYDIARHAEKVSKGSAINLAKASDM